MTSYLDVPLRDRVAAGQALAEQLAAYSHRSDVIVLALPRGGVPVAYEVATALNVRLDILLVRKLGVPGYAELAMGAIASGGVRVLNRDVIESQRISTAAIETVAEREAIELQRRDRAYRGNKPPPALSGQQVILIDDGLATGATMRAAIAAVRQQHPARIIVAVPVAAPDSIATLRTLADELVCLLMPKRLMAIGHWYQDFSQTSDDEVMSLLQQAWQHEASRRPN